LGVTIDNLTPFRNTFDNKDLKWLADFPWKLEFHHRNYDLKYCSSVREFSRWFPNNLKGFCLLLVNISQINENPMLIAQIAAKTVSFLVKTAHIKCARDSGHLTPFAYSWSFMWGWKMKYWKYAFESLCLKRKNVLFHSTVFLETHVYTESVWSLKLNWN